MEEKRDLMNRENGWINDVVNINIEFGVYILLFFLYLGLMLNIKYFKIFYSLKVM